MFDLFEAEDILNKLEEIINELIEVLESLIKTILHLNIQLLKKRAAKYNNPVKLMIEKFLDVLRDYVNKFLERFQQAIRNEKAGTQAENSTVKSLSIMLPLEV